MRKYLILCKESLRISIAAATTYRLNFILGSFITLVSNIMFPLVTLLIYQTGVAFEGWTLYEVLLIQSIFTLSSGLSQMFFYGIVFSTMGHVREGTLEIVLIKPVNCLFYLMATTFNVENVSVVLGGLVLFLVAIVNVGTITAVMWMQFAILFIAGILVMLAMSLLMAATSFKWVANSRIPEMYSSILRFGIYPQSIFPKLLQSATAFVIPVAMVGFFPAASLLGRTDFLMFVAILPCLLFVGIGITIYQRMVRLYEGVGG